MNKTLRLCIISAALAAAHPVHAQDYSLNVVGYYTYRFYPGQNLFQNNLSVSNNLLSTIFGVDTPIGTTVSLWNPAANTFAIESEYLGLGSWTTNFSLGPGMGARLTAPSLFTNTFVGTVLNRAGGFFSDGQQTTPAPLFAGPNGIYLLGDKVPMASTGNDVFRFVIGRLPNEGEQFTRLDAVSQTYITSTYNGGAWDIVPSHQVGDAAFFNIGPVPEPSVAGLWLIGLTLFKAVLSRRPS